MGRRRSDSTTGSHPATVPVASIAHNPRNRRENYNDVEELAGSIEDYGVLQPLGIVRYEIFLARFPEHEDDIGSAHWVVIQGNRRLAAARQAGLDEVPVVVQEQLGRADTFDESILIENVHREDLPILREAALLQELLRKYGTQRSLATAIKKSQAYISQRLSLLNLVPTLQDEVSRGDLAFAGARDLAGLPQEDQVEAYKAGPPYKAPSRGQGSPEPDDYAVISDVPPEGVSMAAATESGTLAEAVSEGEVDYGVINDSEPASKVGSARPRRRFPEPSALVQQLRKEYTEEQLEELAQLLRE